MVFLLSTYLLPSLSSLPLLLYHHHIFLHPFSSPCPSSHLFFNHVLQIPPSLIHFLHAISPPPLRLTPPPSPHSLFIHSSSSLFSPFFFSSSLLFPLFSPFFSFPLPPLLLFPPPFVVSILVSLFDPSIFETGNDLVIYVRRNRKETWKIITNFEKYMYVLMFSHISLFSTGCSSLSQGLPSTWTNVLLNSWTQQIGESLCYLYWINTLFHW